MFNRILSAIAWNQNQKELNKLDSLVWDINRIYETMHDLSDDEVRAKTEEFKKRVIAWETLDDLLPEAFAVVKQACKRMVWNSYDVKGEKQTWNMIPYDVQLLWAAVLHKWKIAEMKTGEGKTLVAAMPVYLNALAGKWVHVVTVNDYLASRDGEWMWNLYQRLGLSIGIVTKGVPPQSRREQYACDITYVENSELWFDYLRDNLVKNLRERNLLRRPLNYAIVDEIDSILIDEARTPLIISQAADEPTEKYLHYAKIAWSLIAAKWPKKVSKGFLHDIMNDAKDTKDGVTSQEEDDQHGDYFIDEKTKTATLSSEWIAKLEKMLNVENLYKDLGYDEIHHIENALKAKAVYRPDKEYIVQWGEILIVDANTGRAMPGRRFSQWLHQAIEAKEWVTIRRESKTMATITYQNFFKQYKKLSGMTGTAVTEGEEFSSIYDLDVLEIPTNKPVIRVDKSDKVYFSQKAKRDHTMDYIQFAHSMWQPILIGTSAIHTSESLSQQLTQRSIQHSVLNAKFHEQEAKIVSNAGKKSSVVVATNMAWRGTDIKLDEDLNATLAINYAQWIKKSIHNEKNPKIVSATVYSQVEYDWLIATLKDTLELNDENIAQSQKKRFDKEEQQLAIRIKMNSSKKNAEDAYAEIIVRDPTKPDLETIERDLHFGLMILATEKHDSRRIDNQLRGRAGRQGDPWISVFMVALDDDIMKKVGGEKIRSLAWMLMGADELNQMELTQKQFATAIQRAQKQMEWRHFSTRKHLFDYDSVVDKQRQQVYAKRDMMLHALDEVERIHGEQKDSDIISTGESPVAGEVLSIIPKVVDELMTYHQAVRTPPTELVEILKKECNIDLSNDELKEIQSSNQLASLVTQHIVDHVSVRSSNVPDHVQNRLLSTIYLQVIDRYRVQHLSAMQYLRDKVGLMSYAQQDPLVVYKKEWYEKFTALMKSIYRETVINVANIDWENLEKRVKQAEEQRQKQQDALLQKLSNVAANAPEKLVKQVEQLLSWQNQTENLKREWNKVVYQDEDWFEIIDLSEQWPAANQVENTKTNAKLRPNDKVNVRYPDGRIEYDLKYKKVKDAIDKGEVELLS